MTLEFDHLFICTPVGAPAADHLLAFGLGEGDQNTHAGQGTACRRFFLQNAYLEFVWVHDEAQARSELVRPLCLWERCQYQQTGASPFGIALRRAPADTEPGSYPFTTWAYRPPYMPADSAIEIADNSSSATEPLLFCLPVQSRPASFQTERKQPLQHAAGVRKITGLRITLSSKQPFTQALRAIGRAGLCEFISGESPLAEVILDHGQQNRQIDFRPDLPLRLGC